MPLLRRISLGAGACEAKGLGQSDGRSVDQQSTFKPFVLPVKRSIGASRMRDPAEADEAADKETATAFHRERNVQACRSGQELAVKRLPFLSFMSVAEDRERNEIKLRQPFKSPVLEQRSAESLALLQRKTLGIRRRLSTGLLKPMIKHNLMDIAAMDVDDQLSVEPENVTPLEETPAENAKPREELPPPLVLWQDPENTDNQVVVPEIVGKWLRPHQREGVQFMFDCVCQVRGFDGSGCILADDMGLGKTLQSIALMYTLLMTGKEMQPTIKRAIIVCPTSLVKNWDDELIKWLHGRVKTIALYEASRDVVIDGISRFIRGSINLTHNSAQVLILSYETFRTHAKRFHDAPSCCELLICDEAHRLKNSSSKINKALSALACRKRVLLSGTPMQNDLEEFYAMVDFTNPDILGDPRAFRKNYLNPILVGREPDATDKQRNVAQSCSTMLCEIVNQFILRRGNILNAKHLPPKLIQVVCCPLSPLQEQLYSHFLHSRAFHDMMRRANANVLSSITALKKLCNHPSLLFDDRGGCLTKLAGFDNCEQFFHRFGTQDNGRRERTCHPEWSGKMLLLDKLMQSMRKHTDDRIVIVSNYTQTLDVVSALCRERHWPFVRLDGTTTSSKRKKLVDAFNDPTTNSFAFLLSSKAGGCGINLIGANRLVLFDPDWNPATDKQAAARVWREGQKKQCFVYRFLATGTLEEKIFQRQLSKEGLQSIVDDKEEVNSLSSKDLKRLFVLKKETVSETHDKLKCDRCKWRKNDDRAIDHDQDADEEQSHEFKQKPDNVADESAFQTERYYHPQIGMPPEEDLNNWGHHRGYDSVADEIMQKAIEDTQLVSFAFSCRVDWELLQEHQDKEARENAVREKQLKRKAEEISKPSEDSTASSSESEDDFNDSSSGASSITKRSRVIEILSDDDSDSDLEPVMPKTTQRNGVDQFIGDVAKEEALSENACESKGDDRAVDVHHGDQANQQRYHDRAYSLFSDSEEEETKESEDTVVEIPDPSTDEDDSIETWSCSRCTLKNPVSNDLCDGCGLRFRRSKLHAPMILD